MAEPTLGASAGASRSRRGEGGASTSYDIGLDARWEIDLWGRVRRLVEASRAVILTLPCISGRRQVHWRHRLQIPGPSRRSTG